MKLHIKNMVCPRCISAVGQLLQNIRAGVAYVQLGEVLLTKPLDEKQLAAFKSELEKIGFELLDDSRTRQIEKIKSIVIDRVHNQKDGKFVFAEVISHELNKEYSALSKLFSETEGITIEQFVIQQKIEKVKELLAYDEMNLSEIAFKLGYSSVAHLSSQFKKMTGLTPSGFKAQGIHHRNPIDANYNKI